MQTRVIFRVPQDTRHLIRQADALAGIIDQQFKRLTGKANVLPGNHGAPVICIVNAGLFWELRCNDDNEISSDNFNAIADDLKKWDNTPLMS